MLPSQLYCLIPSQNPPFAEINLGCTRESPAVTVIKFGRSVGFCEHVVELIIVDSLKSLNHHGYRENYP